MTFKDQGSTLFSITSWLIWKHRNNLIFKGINYSSMDLIATNTAWIRDSVNRTRMNSIYNRDYTQGFCQPPTAGWVKINTDGSFTAQSSSAAVGGVFRDHEGEWLLLAGVCYDDW
ncbi:hypothetical protein PVK06_005290 [Gossypium arboreum]|uniref:Uncharacterized protein n=1 Tax=Gossypium arboreum TaxID=29729 RepID=A0ABR0QU79_GOSAR|nr:hypothetical protein PVK06_005290 [Gossypium arboreum]